MFGTYEKYNLVRVSFGRHASNTIIYEDFYKQGQLRLGNNWTGESPVRTDYVFDLKLTVGGAPVSYTYFCDEGSLTLRSDSGDARVEIALTDRLHFRIRGENAGLRLELRSLNGGSAKALLGAFALPDGSGWEADFGNRGKLFFKSLSGAYSVYKRFCNEKNEFAQFIVDFLPDSATGEFEAAVHDYHDSVILPFGQYEDFDELVESNKADFANFAAIYAKPAPGFEEVAHYAKWVVWTHRTKAIGSFQQPHIIFQNTWGCAAAPWQQSYNAMPMLENPAEAWRQICVMFLYQDEKTGRVPNMMTYTTEAMFGMQPAFQGFALDFLYRKIGDDFISVEDAKRMYPKMAAWVDYWTTYRSAGRGDDVTALHGPHESGWDDASIFKDGVPASDPNNMAFLVLLMEAVSRMAAKSGDAAVSDEWAVRAKKLTDILVNEFWDGEKFATFVKGKPVDSLSLSCYQPIILGKRLPQEIIDKVAEKLTEEGGFLTEIGLASESMKSDRITFGESFTSGRVIAPQNMILTVGLQAAGKQKEADLIARRYCTHAQNEGIILGYAPYNYYKFNGAKADQQIPPHFADGWPWSSWGSNCVLTMSTGVIGK
jgi:hypothetical protein